MRVLVSSRTATVGVRPDGIEVVTLEDLFSLSDFVSVHCPLNEEPEP